MTDNTRHLNAFAHVDLNAIASNMRRLREVIDVPILAVVKADAYGHGLIPVAKAALDAGATWLGTAKLDEAIALRRAGITAPILAWLLPPGSDFQTAVDLDIDLSVGSFPILQEIRALGGRPRIHLKVDVGLSRNGFQEEDWQTLLNSDLSDLNIVGIFSQLSRSEVPDAPENLEQRQRFERYVADLHARNIRPIRHLANSAAAWLEPATRFDMVRCGIALYGLSPSIDALGTSQQLGLIPAMSVKAKLVSVKRFPTGTPIGYGQGERTTRETLIGIVALGYADGPPKAARGICVEVNGQHAPLIGTPCMDQFMVDLGPESTAQPGEWVTVLGEHCDAEAWGAKSHSSGCEITLRYGTRLPRVY